MYCALFLVQFLFYFMRQSWRTRMVYEQRHWTLSVQSSAWNALQRWWRREQKHNRSCTTYRHIRTCWMSSCYRACSNTLTKISTSHFPQWMGKSALMFLVRNIVILLLNREMDRFITLAIDSHRSSIGIQWKWLTFVFDTLQWWWKTRKTQTHTHSLTHSLHPIHSMQSLFKDLKIIL